MARRVGGRLGRGAPTGRVAGGWAGGRLGKGVPKAPQAPRPGGGENGRVPLNMGSWATWQARPSIYRYGQRALGPRDIQPHRFRTGGARARPTPTPTLPGWKKFYQGFQQLPKALGR